MKLPHHPEFIKPPVWYCQVASNYSKSDWPFHIIKSSTKLYITSNTAAHCIQFSLYPPSKHSLYATLSSLRGVTNNQSTYHPLSTHIPTHSLPTTTTTSHLLHIRLIQTNIPSQPNNQTHTHHEFNVSQKLYWGRLKIRRRWWNESAEHKGVEQQSEPKQAIQRPRLRKYGWIGALSHPLVLRSGSRCNRSGPRRLDNFYTNSAKINHTYSQIYIKNATQTHTYTHMKSHVVVYYIHMY